MLDENYPERQGSVGNRGAAPTNDTKIQLFKTVQRFLEDGAGKMWFSAAGGGNDGERWEYPRDEDKLIALLTPLMRRMVTNERQRQYAKRTRRSGGSGGKLVAYEVCENSVSFPVLKDLYNERLKSSQNAASPPQKSPKTPIAVSKPNHTQPLPPERTPAENAIEMIFLQNNHVKHKSTVSLLIPMSTPSYSNLTSTIRAQLSQHQQQTNAGSSATPALPEIEETFPVDEDVRKAREAYRAALQKAALAAAAQVLPSFEIEAHTARGLVTVDGPEAWEGVVREVREIVWMCGYLRVVIKVRVEK